MTAMWRLTRVETNINAGKGYPRSLDFNTITALVGDVGAGKTRWAIAISLLLSEKADDLLGKAGVKSTAEIDALLPEGESELYAIGHFERPVGDNGKVETGKIEYRVGRNAKGTGPTSTPRWSSTLEDYQTALPLALPVREVAAWLDKTPRDAWTAFLPYVAAGVSAQAILDLIPEAVTAGLVEAPETLADLVALEARAKQEAKKHEDAAKASRAAFTRAESGLDAEPTAEDLEAAARRFTEATSRLRVAGQQRAVEKYRELMRRIKRADEVIERDAPDPGPPSKAKKVLDLLARGEALQRDAKALGLPFCPSTGMVYAEVPTHYAERMTIAQATLTERAAAWSEANAKRVRLLDAKARIENEARALRSTLDPEAAKLPPIDPEEAQADLEAAQAEHTRLQRIVAGWETAANERDREARMKVAAQRWSMLHEQAQAAVKTLIARSVRGFAEEAGKYLPATYRLTILTDDNERMAFRPVLYRGSEALKALSGGQRAMVLYALSRAVLARMAETPAVVICTLPEERSFGPNTFGAFLRTLAEHITGPQVVLTNIVPPDSDVIANNVSVVDVSALRVNGSALVVTSPGAFRDQTSAEPESKPEKKPRGRRRNAKSEDTVSSAPNEGADPDEEPPASMNTEAIALLANMLDKLG